MGTLQVVVGGQYGSEGKGAVAAWLAAHDHHERMTAVRVAGPNAGHTVIDPLTGSPVALRCIPTAAVVNPDAMLCIAPGSEIDLDVLRTEIEHLENDLSIKVNGRLLVDPQATILTAEHREAEGALVGRIGSTGKGIGAARADRTMRTARLAGEGTWGDGLGDLHDVASWCYDALATARTVVVEGTQGYGLGLHAGHYPQCTSSDARALDFLSMAGLSPWAPSVTRFEAWVVLRTYPIRVAGNSGPMFNECSWDYVSVHAERTVTERTTVTQKTRRVGHWDSALARDAIIANGGPGESVKVALTFLDYVVPAVANRTGAAVWDNADVRQYVQAIEADIGCRVNIVTTGPEHVTVLL